LLRDLLKCSKTIYIILELKLATSINKYLANKVISNIIKRDTKIL